MRLAVNGLTALRVLRALRRGAGRVPSSRCELPAPDPSPRRRFTPGVLPLERLQLSEPPSAEHPVHVAVPSERSRLQARFASCTIYGDGLPASSFVDVGDGIVIPCPELLFVELARIMDPETHALLGYELCGTFSRDPIDPRCGDVTYGVAPATTVERIECFMDACKGVRGLPQARRTLRDVRDNAWSATESVMALVLTLPRERFGFGFDVALNVRHEASPELVRRGAARSRVPDIELVGTSIGFNYDGNDHFDLGSIAAATDWEAQRLAMEVRRRYVDDLRRNRELAAQGHFVMPVVSEDLFGPGAFDTLVLEAVLAMGAIEGRPPATLEDVLDSWASCYMRQLLIWSLLPWRKGARYARERRSTHIERGVVVYEEEIEFPV